MHFIAENEKDLIEKVYQTLEDNLKAPFCVAFVGDLGAGKTALVRGICEKMGIDEVTSPTFTIRKSYETESGVKIQHLDLYRFSPDADSREIEEYIEDDDFITFVEWPENINYSLEKYNAIIKLEDIADGKRKAEIICN